MLDELGLEASQSVFVDDIEAYARGATDFGMKGIHFQSAEQLREDLRKIGLRV